MELSVSARIGRDLLLRQEKLRQANPRHSLEGSRSDSAVDIVASSPMRGNSKTVITAAIARELFRLRLGDRETDATRKLPRASKLKSRDCEEEAIDHNSSKELGKAGGTVTAKENPRFH